MNQKIIGNPHHTPLIRSLKNLAVMPFQMSNHHQGMFLGRIETVFNGKINLAAFNQDQFMVVVIMVFREIAILRRAPREIPGRFEVIPESAFEGSDSFRYNIESGIREIGKKAFRGCSKLDELTLPDTLETIEEEAFAACPRLKTATIPETVTFIGDSAFDKDTITLIVEEGSYAETWARDNGYIYQYTDSDDLSWLNN